MQYLQVLFILLASWFFPGMVEAERIRTGIAADGVRQKEEPADAQPRTIATHVYEYVGEPGEPAWPADGLGECQADCDRDDQCQDGLLCMSRDKDEDVPGCTGEAVESKDYCYNATTSMPTASPAPSETPTTSPAPTGTPGPTPHPTTGFPTSSPSVSLEPTISPAPSYSPSMAPTRLTLVVLDDSQKPFRKCEGICSDNDDCYGELRCQKRGGNEWVPGCEGDAPPGANFCYDMKDGAAPPPLPSPGFRLKLYWEREYYWQETYVEAKWCLQDIDPPQVKKCGSSSTKYEFVYLPGEGDQIKVVGKDRCLDRTARRNITYEPCNPNDINQRWKGNWGSRRFDIRNAANDMCFTQHHHPKSGEIVSLWSCLTAHFTSTGYWNIY